MAPVGTCHNFRHRIVSSVTMDSAITSRRASEKPQRTPAASESPSAPESSNISHHTAPAPFADRIVRVLLVDDQTLVRAGVRAMLDQEADIEIVGEAATGEEAILLAERCRPDVVLMDLDMPGAGGMIATRALTAPDRHPFVLVLTMHSESERLVEALRAGASGYITKDVARDELAAAVRIAAAGDVYVRPHVGPMLAASFRAVVRPSKVDHTRANFEALSEREQAVLRLVAEGHTGPEIGRALGITSKTVDTYRHRIQQKIGLAHRTDYVRFALRIDLLKK
jgi:two-component system, NarL family, response regulator NreC